MVDPIEFNQINDLLPGMMPGIGFIGGRLSIVGGYSWPGGVDLIEEWDDDNGEWVPTDRKIRYAR